MEKRRKIYFLSLLMSLRSHIPYRDSKLTRILSNAVGGNSLTAVICAVSPALQNFTQTLSTLRFASRAKRVRNAATMNVEEGIMDQKLKAEVKNLREKLNNVPFIPSNLV